MSMSYYRWRSCPSQAVAPSCFSPPIYMSLWRIERWFYGLLGWLYLSDVFYRPFGNLGLKNQWVLETMLAAPDHKWGPCKWCSGGGVVPSLKGWPGPSFKALEMCSHCEKEAS